MSELVDDPDSESGAHYERRGSTPLTGTMCEKCDEVKRIVEEWASKQGHDRCWYYPDLFRQITVALEIDIEDNSSLPPRCEFEEGCKKYQDEEYGSA